MSAGNLNLSIEQGADFSRRITVTDSNSVALSVTDISGQIRKSYSDPSVLASFTVEAISTGVFKLKIAAADTAQIPVKATSAGETRPATKYIYDVVATVNGDRVRLLEGTVSVSPGVSR